MKEHGIESSSSTTHVVGLAAPTIDTSKSIKEHHW
jgi:hypothetical protein